MLCQVTSWSCRSDPWNIPVEELIFRKLARCNLHHWKNLDTFTGFLKVFALDSRKTEHLSLYVFLVLKKNSDLPNGESNGILIMLNGFCWKNKVGTTWLLGDGMKNNGQNKGTVYMQSNLFPIYKQRSLGLERPDFQRR